MRVEPGDHGQPRLILLTIGDLTSVPRQAIDGVRASGAEVVHFTTPTAAGEWLTHVRGGRRALRIGDLELDRELGVAVRGGSRLDLTDRDFELLLAFAEAPERTLTFAQLDVRVWGDRRWRDTTRIRSAVQRLRRKLRSSGTHCALRSIHGSGYRLVVGN